MSLKSVPVACSQHNHTHCISSALTAARLLCCERGVRLTQLREQVLGLIWQSHKPLGAYTLMEMLGLASIRRIAPPTVYRALEFLLAEGLIHRIHSLNAFIGCPTPMQKHHSHFLICQVCSVVVEISNPLLGQRLEKCAADAGFSTISQSIEVSGFCSTCLAASNERKSHA